MKKIRISLLPWYFILSMLTLSVHAGNAEHPGDTHYDDAGFFDIHVCNWPDRAPFYMALFSTFRFNEVKSIELINASGDQFASLDLSKYRVIKADKKPEKRVFINQVAQPKKFADGWFSAKVTLTDGTVHITRDFVQHGLLSIVDDVQPTSHEQLIEIPKTLSWTPVAGAGYYQVFIKDKWDMGKVIFSSKILHDAKVELPDDLLEYGGNYVWQVHARDVNEDIKLGDFNLGSLSSWYEFSVAD
ncbi:MAG: hypothetical protein OEZ15_02745 [Gammaproteobacteria bacterium]|nr:hypothetical protein [Gammaproteobacteria bacterium]